MNKTLEEIENDFWDEPVSDSSIVATCHELRKKPLDQLSAEDLRLLIGQNIGLPILLPEALKLLVRQPLTSGDLYEGDLLKAVIDCDWAKKDSGKNLNALLVRLCKNAMKQLENAEISSTVSEDTASGKGLLNRNADDATHLRLDRLKSATPYREFSEFCRSSTEP